MKTELQKELIEIFDDYATEIIPVGQLGYVYKGILITHLLYNPELEKIEVWAGAEEYSDCESDFEMLDALQNDKHAEQILMSNEELDDMLKEIIDWI